MAFVKIDKSHRSGIGENNASVSMSAYLADGKMHKSKSVSFRISYALFLQLGWEAVDRRLRIGVFEGTDKDAGLLQLMPDPRGYASSISLNSLGEESRQGVAISVTIERFRHYVLNDCPVSSTLVEHVIDDGALVIQCPDWLRFNPQSISKPIVEAPPEPSPPEPSPPPKSTSVTQLRPGKGHRRQG